MVLYLLDPRQFHLLFLSFQHVLHVSVRFQLFPEEASLGSFLFLQFLHFSTDTFLDKTTLEREKKQISIAGPNKMLVKLTFAVSHSLQMSAITPTFITSSSSDFLSSPTRFLYSFSAFSIHFSPHLLPGKLILERTNFQMNKLILNQVTFLLTSFMAASSQKFSLFLQFERDLTTSCR